eukprot:TRINITY_DN46677_c0_g1_i1.p1 TRINITY_DN46677_c0_g1~~TRINITY_DN46677_c0_g1_i1.p1  ORF type:complete len:280 (-),score=46.93 TRINITY_DN46677_c0_g1_i1:264-1103(-)
MCIRDRFRCHLHEHLTGELPDVSRLATTATAPILILGLSLTTALAWPLCGTLLAVLSMRYSSPHHHQSYGIVNILFALVLYITMPVALIMLWPVAAVVFGAAALASIIMVMALASIATLGMGLALSVPVFIMSASAISSVFLIATPCIWFFTPIVWYACSPLAVGILLLSRLRVVHSAEWYISAHISIAASSRQVVSEHLDGWRQIQHALPGGLTPWMENLLSPVLQELRNSPLFQRMLCLLQPLVSWDDCHGFLNQTCLVRTSMRSDDGQAPPVAVTA